MTTRDHFQRTTSTWLASGWPRPASPTGSRCGSRTTARSGSVRRHRQRGDDRGRGRGLLADLLRDSSTGCSPRAAGSHSRPSRWTTSGSWRPAGRSAGSRSTSSPAAYPLAAVDRRNLAAHTTLRVTAGRSWGRTTPRTLRLWRDRFNEHWPQIHAPGFDETFRGCGSSTWPTARRASAAATSASASSSSPGPRDGAARQGGLGGRRLQRDRRGRGPRAGPPRRHGGHLGPPGGAAGEGVGGRHARRTG